MDNSKIDFQSLTENSVDMICQVGPDLVMHYVSPSCERLLGWTPAEMCGRGPDIFVHSEDLPIIAAARQRLAEYREDEVPTTIRMRKKDGSYAWMEIYARLLESPGSERAKDIVLTMRNITLRKERERKLEALALTDPLTGLANRRAFDKALDLEWKRALRTQLPISLILLDIDHFKQFNDSHGHLLGDECLRSVANATSLAVRRIIDTVARYGGEEFAILLPDTKQDGAVLVAESVRLKIEAIRLSQQGLPANNIRVTASAGVATAWDSHGKTISTQQDMLLAADAALYKAKHEGRNRVSAAPL